ncbi:hypothetical protein PUN28_011299 [Cardiocondyla obscurior]|uniref:Uncharacterized protein n=1 Tax=Cardiocondyla obscurior TaxID=286306 RepID=A0AAW2FIT6_9HYME
MKVEPRRRRWFCASTSPKTGMRIVRPLDYPPLFQFLVGRRIGGRRFADKKWSKFISDPERPRRNQRSTMIDDRSRYLRHSRENFSNIVPSVLVRQWYFHSRGRRQTDPSGAALGVPANSQKGARASRIKNGRRGERGSSGGRWRGTCATSSGRQKTKGTNKRATGRQRRRVAALHRGFVGRTAKGDEDISYKALLSGWVAGVAIVLCFDSARRTRLTFNRCVFADDVDGRRRSANRANNIVTLSSCHDYILLLPIVPSSLPLATPADRERERKREI